MAYTPLKSLIWLRAVFSHTFLMPGIFPAISLMPLMAFSRSLFETVSLNLYTTTCSTVFGWPKRFCTGTLRACSEPAAIPATNITAPRAICEARFMADVISSSAMATLPVYVTHAGRSNPRQQNNAAAPPNWFDGRASRPIRSQGKTSAEAGFSFGGAEGEEVLGSFDRFLKAAEEDLEVVAALDEVDVGGVDDQEIGGGVAEEEMFVGAGDFLDVFGGDVGFVAGGFFGDAGAEDFGLGLEIDDQVGSGNVRGEGFVVALVELEFSVIEIEIGEDAVLFHEEIGEDGAGSFDGEGFAEALLAFDEEVHLGAQGGAGLGFVEVSEEGIVLAIVDAAVVEAFVRDACVGGFADAERAFNDDEAGRLGGALRRASACVC